MARKQVTTKFSSFLLLHAKIQKKRLRIEFSELRRKSYQSLVSCNPTNKSISVFIFLLLLLLSLLPKILCEYVHQQVFSSPKLKHQDNARAFGEQKSDYDFGFVILLKHNGSTGSSSFLCSLTLSLQLLSTMVSQNFSQIFCVSPNTKFVK